MALDNGKKFAGAMTAGWHAFNITSDQGSGIGGWSDDEVFAYLATGHALGRGTAAGPMGKAVDQSFSQMAPSDIRALVSYVARSARRLARPTGDARTASAGCLRTVVRPQMRWARRSSKNPA